MSEKYYRCVKDNFLWKKGAILFVDGDQVRPISDVWDVNEHVDSEYISLPNIVANPEWFERVYKVDLIKSTVYKVKAEAQKLLDEQMKGA